MAAILSLYAAMMLLVSITLTIHWYMMHRRLMSSQMQLLYQYGKTLKPGNNNTNAGFSSHFVYNIVTSTIPKSCFRFFYVAAVAMNIICFLRTEYFESVIQLLFCRGDIVSSPHSIYLLIFGLEMLQVLRRCYECFFVSIYSPSSRMNLSHLVLGFWFYAVVALVITNFGYLDVGIEATSVSMFNVIVGLMCYCAGYWIQFESHLTLERLRRRKRPDGKRLIVTYDHMIPYGHLFDLVSNPHYFAEVLIYAAFLIISEFDFTFQLLFFYVLIAHMAMGEQSHRWYKETFKDLYPENRKILIPWIF